MVEIVKVQRTISPPDGDWLIYDRRQKHMVQVPAGVIPAHVRQAMGSAYKALFVGAWSSVVGWGLSKRAPDQDW